MCGTVLKVGFIIIVAIGTMATIVSMFTPGWQQNKNGSSSMGIISYNCGSEPTDPDAQNCREWWSNKEPWEKAVIVFMALALVLEIFILGWTILSCFAFCCPSIFVPLPILCGFVTVFLIVAISIYGAKNHDKIGHLPRNNNQLNGMDNVGYSFWIGTFSLIMMGIATLVGCAVSVTSKVLP